MLYALIPIWLVQAVAVWIIAAISSTVASAIIAGIFLLVNTILTIVLTRERRRGETPEDDPDPEHPHDDARSSKPDRSADSR